MLIVPTNSSIDGTISLFALTAASLYQIEECYFNLMSGRIW